MGKGTPARGKKNNPHRIRCRRCGRRSYHVRHKKVHGLRVRGQF